MSRSPGLGRPVDAVAGALGLIVLSPVLLLSAVAVRLSSRGPVLFRQQRVGFQGQPFTLLKFRTMTASGTGPEVTMRGDARVTAVGRLLRRTKLDELPELWNVLRGEMALVGPRPEVPTLVDLADPMWREVLSVRPGITDPVTLNLRDEEVLLAGAGEDPQRFYRERLLPWKLRGYASYLRRRTVWSDLGVLVATVAALLALGRSRAPGVEELGGK